MTRIESQTATGSRSTPDHLQAVLALLTAQKSDSALAIPLASAYSETILRARDAVRLTKDSDGMSGGSEGVILGWYANEPENVIVSLSEGGVANLPREALELIDESSVAPVYLPA